MKYILMILILAAAMLQAVEPASQATSLKVCYLNPDSLLVKSTAYQKAAKEYEKLQNSWQNELDLLMAEVKRLQGLVNAGDSSEATKKRLKKANTEFETARGEIYGEGGEAEVKHEELIKPLLDNTQKAINDLAAEMDIDVIIDVTTTEVIYLKESIEPTNITDEIAEGVDKAGK